MKQFFRQSTLIIALIALAYTANIAAAQTAIAPPCGSPITPGCVSSSNTPFPVHVGSTAQVKAWTLDTSTLKYTGGGLSVGAFTAAAIAEFQKNVYVNGLVVGNPVDIANPEDLSNVTIGGSSPATLTIAGTTYVKNGGLFSNKVIAPSGTVKPVCADNNGNIIFCPPGQPPVYTPEVTYPKEHYAVAYNVSSKATIGTNAEDLARAGTATDVISLDTKQSILIDKLNGFSSHLSSLAHHIDGNGKGVVDDNAKIWAVPDTASYDFSFSSYGFLSTYMVPRSRQRMDVSFYIKIVKLNGTTTIVPLANQKAGGCVALLPDSGTNKNQRVDDTAYLWDPSAQYIMYSPDCTSGGSSPDTTDDIWTYRKHTGTISYDVHYSGTLALSAGDAVYLYATGTGFGRRHEFSAGQSSQGSKDTMDFTFKINNLALDVIER